VPKELNNHFGNAEEANLWFQSPLGQAILYAPGTPQRDATIEAYKHVQRVLCITGICLCIPLIFFACCIRNPILGKEQSLPEAERTGAVVREDEEAGRKKGILGMLKN
jgi:SIT family siderophore-iron:H+ symporter-like MFS transporter